MTNTSSFDVHAVLVQPLHQLLLQNIPNSVYLVGLDLLRSIEEIVKSALFEKARILDRTNRTDDIPDVFISQSGRFIQEIEDRILSDLERLVRGINSDTLAKKLLENIHEAMCQGHIATDVATGHRELVYLKNCDGFVLRKRFMAMDDFPVLTDAIFGT